MEPISGVQLGKLTEPAEQAYRKLVQARVSDMLKGLLVQEHNLRMKSARLRGEAEQADLQRQSILERIEKFKNNDWTAVEPFEISDKALPPEKKSE